MMKTVPLIQDLMTFLDASPTAWHAVENMEKKLKKQGFKEIQENETWELKPGQCYFVKRNHSSLCAFITPHSTSPQRVRLLASHTDSPSFKLKPQPEIRKHQAILLGFEIYGGPLLTSWLNRDLGLAGRVVYYDQQHQLRQSLVRLERYPLTIPQLAIHLDREVNEKGLLLNKQEHLHALAALEQDFPSSSYLETILSEQLNFTQIVNHDLYLFPLEKARLIGYQQQLLASYRIDSLSSVHAALSAFLKNSAPLEEDIKMVIFWDNEEVGSNTAQGAASPFFNQTLERILLALQLTRDDYFQVLNRSTCISIDLAHALHPNYPERHDFNHQPLLGKGVVLKNNAQMRYASDAYSSIPVQVVAHLHQIPLQKFVSRNDTPCGSTIGPIQACQSGMPTVDIGCGQLSMHACRELMACQDQLLMHKLLEELLQTDVWPCPTFIEASRKN